MPIVTKYYQSSTSCYHLGGVSSPQWWLLFQQYIDYFSRTGPWMCTFCRLPHSFPGSQKYFEEERRIAEAASERLNDPDFMLTFTMNEWGFPEIKVLSGTVSHVAGDDFDPDAFCRAPAGAPEMPAGPHLRPGG